MQVFPQAHIAEIAARSVPEKRMLKAQEPGVEAGFLEFMGAVVVTRLTDVVEAAAPVLTEVTEGESLEDLGGKADGKARPNPISSERQMDSGSEDWLERVGDGVSLAPSGNARVVEIEPPARCEGPPGLAVAMNHTTLPEQVAEIVVDTVAEGAPPEPASAADQNMPTIPGPAEDVVPKTSPMIAKAGPDVTVDPGKESPSQLAKPVEPTIGHGQHDVTTPGSRVTTGSAEVPVITEGAGAATLLAGKRDDDAGIGRSSVPEGHVLAETVDAGHPAVREKGLISPKETGSPVRPMPMTPIPADPVEQRGLRHGDETAPVGSPEPAAQRSEEAVSIALATAHRPERDLPLPVSPHVPHRVASADEDRPRHRDKAREPAIGRGVPDPIRPHTAGPSAASTPLSGPLVAEAVATNVGERGAHPLTHGAEVAAMQGREPAGPHAPDRTAGEPAATRSIVAQVVHSVSRSQAEGVVEIRLQPEELGRVRLTMTPSEVGVSVHVTAERPETLDLLRRHIDMLAADLGDRGFSNLDFSFGTGGSARGDAFEASDEGSTVTDQAPSAGLQVDLSEQAAPGINGTLDIRL